MFSVWLSCCSIDYKIYVEYLIIARKISARKLQNSNTKMNGRNKDYHDQRKTKVANLHVEVSDCSWATRYIGSEIVKMRIFLIDSTSIK